MSVCVNTGKNITNIFRIYSIILCQASASSILPVFLEDFNLANNVINYVKEIQPTPDTDKPSALYAVLFP